VQRVGLLLICLTGTQLGNAERPRWCRVTNGRIILWRRLCKQRSTGRYLDSWCNRVDLLFCTLDTIPLWSSFQVVSRSSRPAGSPLLVHPLTGGHRFSAARPLKTHRKLVNRNGYSNCNVLKLLFCYWPNKVIMKNIVYHRFMNRIYENLTDLVSFFHYSQIAIVFFLINIQKPKKDNNKIQMRFSPLDENRLRYHVLIYFFMF
jgi:hypothetical protein